MAPTLSLQIEERDQAGSLVATYEHGAKQQNDKSDINITVPANSRSWTKEVINAFMPAGYPQSVTPDYLPYQIYDSLQAFSSSIASLLASRAVLESVGVGSSSSSPTTAILLSVLQSSLGRFATILFAARLGTSLEPECKMYRFLADILNDSAMLLDCLSPALSRTPRVVVLSLGSCLRALCGVSAGSSKASLSKHFATQGNLGELNAKDSSQETIISLLGMWAGSLVVSRITSQRATWSCLIFLLGVHLMTNYLAVRSVYMRTLNRQRAGIVFSAYLSNTGKADSHVYTPFEVSQLERIFEWDGVIRWHGKVVGRCFIGVTLKDILREATSTGLTMDDILAIYQDESYVLYGSHAKHRYWIVLKDTADTQTQLKAWLHAIILYRSTRADLPSSHEGTVQLLKDTLQETSVTWPKLEALLGQKGWDLEECALETRSGTRIYVADALKKVS